MNSKERVRMAFEHCEPDRVPLWYGAAGGLTQRLMKQCGVADEEALMRRLHIDFRRVHARYAGPPLGSKNIWGVERGGEYYGQPLTHPLAGVETVEQVEAFTGWPSPDWFDFSHLRAECKSWRDYAIIGGPWAVVFTDATELVGMAEFFEKMHTHPEVMHAVMGKVSDFYHMLAARFFETCGDLLDIFFFGDDMGTQQALIVSLNHWREFCKPHIRRFIGLGKQAGLKTMFHSCGAVRALIPDLIELGLDALNPVQVRAKGMDLQGLKADFGRQMAFHGAFDHQQVLPFGTVDDVRAEVHRVIDILAPGGGYCLAPSHDLMLDEFPPDNVIALYDEAYAYGQYRSHS